MEQSDIINNFPKKILHYRAFFQKNIFDETFLDEKDKALSPIVLSDQIPQKAINKPKKKQKRKTNFNAKEEKYIRYGSNIIYVDSERDKKNKDDDFHSIMNDQIFKIISDETTF